MSLNKVPEDAVTVLEKAEDHVKVRRNGLTDRDMAVRYVAERLGMKKEDLRIEDAGPGVNLCRISPRSKEAAAAFKAAIVRLDDTLAAPSS